MSDAFDANHLPKPRNGNTDLPDTGFMIRSLAETIATSRAQIAMASGITYGGVRDMYSVLGYDRTLTARKMRDRYNRGDIAARIVEAYPKATWRGGAELIEDPDVDVTTAFEEAWTTFDERLRVWPALQKADILAGLGPYSIVLIGAPGPTESELPRLSGPEAVLYLVPYGAEEATIGSTVTDAEDPRFGLPLTYLIQRSGIAGQDLRKSVHWTRVLHVADRVLDDRVNGNPLLVHVWNRLDDLEKVVGGGSEAFWRRVHQGTILGLKDGIKATETEIQKLKDETDEFIHGMKRFLTLRGVEMEQLGSDVSNFDAQVSSIISLISGATGIPQRILLGSERGELASSQDKENWDERISDRRQDYAEPIVRQLVSRLVNASALPKPKEYHVAWPEVEDLDMVERSTVATAWAGLNSKAGGPVVTPAEIRDKVLGLDPLGDDILAEMDEKAKAEQEAQAAAKVRVDMPMQPGQMKPGQKQPPTEEPPTE